MAVAGGTEGPRRAVRSLARLPLLLLPLLLLPLLLLPLLLSVAAGCADPGQQPPERPLTVFAAASLADAVTELSALCAAESAAQDASRRAGGPMTVEASYAASSTLARQIAAGAPADLLLSADRRQIAAAERAVDPFPLAGNRLVVVVPAASPVDRLGAAAELLRFERLALADPEGVPAGVYVRSWLERAGLWDQLGDRVVPALDVRAALAAVASGELPAGVVYATDAAATDAAGTDGAAGRVRVVYRVPQDEAPPVVYWGAAVMPAAGDRQSDEGAHPRLPGFIRCLTGEAGQAVLARHGFTPPPED